MKIEARVENLEDKFEKLNDNIVELAKQLQRVITRLSKVEPAEEETIENKIIDLREMICRIVIDGIYSYIYEVVYQDFGGKGHDTSEQAIYKANDLIARVGIVSVQTENYNKVFLYVLDPILLIEYDGGKLWDFLCKRVKDYNYHMLLAIGKFKFDENDEHDYYGKYMNTAAREYCEKQDAKIRQYGSL